MLVTILNSPFEADVTTIHELCSISSVASNDELPIYSQENGSTRKASVQVLAVTVGELIKSPQITTVYTVILSGNNFTASPLPAVSGGSVWLQITLSVTAPSGTINLPGSADRADGQELLVTCNQAVTTLTIAGFGASVLGAPASLAANGFFKLRYDLISNCWYRVG